LVCCLACQYTVYCRTFFFCLGKNNRPRSNSSEGATEQSLAADGAIGCFSSSLFPLSLDADRAPQLKRVYSALQLRSNQMPFKESTGYCQGCKKQVLVRQETTNDVLYAILTLFSCGLWGIVWIISSFSNRPWLCTACGRPAVIGDYSRWVRQQEEDERYQKLLVSQQPPYLFTAGTTGSIPCKFCGKLISVKATECEHCGGGTPYGVALEDGLIPKSEEALESETETSRTCAVCHESLFNGRYCPTCREIR
jgi:hypothetical protein